MKSERRHNLEANELVIWLEKFRPYIGQATAVVSVLVVVLAISSIWKSNTSAKHEAAWDAFAIANDTSDPELMAVLSAADDSEYAGTAMPEWAQVTWADRQLLLATQAYLADRPAALSRLKKIDGIYSTLALAASTREVQDRAHFGLARVYELQNKLDEAKKEYEAVQGELSSLASQRAARLELSEVQEACAWLATTELPRRSEQGATGGRPSFDAGVPAASGGELSSKTLENLLGNLVKETAETDDRYSEETKKAAEESAEEDSAASEETSADKEPASETSETETETPAESADEQPVAAEGQ